MIYCIAFIIIFTIVAKYTVFGKSVEATGNNRNAAFLCCMNVSQKVMIVYVITGLFWGLVGIITVTRSGNCNVATLGSLKKLDSIATVVIGGTSIKGAGPRSSGPRSAASSSLSSQ
jgi:ribose/xylose/arabinose/galactoside ABC-type transport system permease subunit